MLFIFSWCVLAMFSVLNECNGAVRNICHLNNTFKCAEDTTCIYESKRCNGKIDCPNGSDETFAECKKYIDYNNIWPENAPVYTCAYGALPPNWVVSGLLANKDTQCADGSDESLSLFITPDSSLINGKCSSNQMQCLSGDCISRDKMCDNQVDCIDGRDESLELCMQPECSYPYFQCANGKCLDPTIVCDNKFDCPDGSDEVPNLCEKLCEDRDLHDICKNRTHWMQIALPRCFEPIGEGVRFTTDTRFHRIQNKKFVYANQAVKFECKEQSKESALSWNVCLNTSEWRTTLPRCRKDNKDPKTNGTSGCPLNYYKNDTMMIWRCPTYKDCNYPIQPPISNQMVKIECNNGYYLANGISAYSNQVKLICEGKIWVNAEEPRCTKFCNFTDLTGLYAINAKCDEGLNFPQVLPGQLASFKCAPGFLDVKREPLPDSECLENGTWSGLTRLRKTQLDLCSYSCMVKPPSGSRLSIDAHAVAPLNAPWIVALYFKQDTYICAGTLIRLDLLLTAAHCLYNKNNIKIKESDLSIRYLKPHSGNTPNNDSINVKEYRIDPWYVNDHLNQYDVAVVLLMRKIPVPLGQGIVCLPWLKHVRFKYPHRSSGGFVDTWIDYKNQTLSVVPFQYYNNGSRADSFNITTNFKLCAGASGSPVVVNCNTHDWEGKCLIGVVSRFTRSVTTCAQDITVANITNTRIESFIRDAEENFW